MNRSEPNITFSPFSLLPLNFGLRVLGAFLLPAENHRLLDSLRLWCSFSSVQTDFPVSPVRKYRTLLVSRFLPASLHLRLLLLYRFPLAFDFGRSSTFRLKCHGIFRPICRICHQDLGDNVCFSS